MEEDYLTMDDMAKILKVNRRTIQRRMPGFKAAGLKVNKVGQLVRVKATSFQHVLDKAASREEALV